MAEPEAKKAKTSHTTPIAEVDIDAVGKYVVAEWDEHVTPTLMEYIKIHNQSPLFDPEWATNGEQEKAVELIKNWVEARNVAGMKLEVLTAPERTPLIFMEIDGTDGNEETVLLYGHLDKQPPLEDDWKEGLGPWTPVLDKEKNGLFGRGGADDGYSAFSAVLAIKALQVAGVPHPRCVIIVEACEESGSRDLPFYIDQLADRIRTPSLIVCLDSGAGNYEQFWVTTSLRGAIVGELRTDIVSEGVHSGDATGIVPSSFRINRMLLSRLEDEQTGKIHDAFHVEIPENRVTETSISAQALGSALVYEQYPWVGAPGPISDDLTQLMLNRSWRPALAVTGVDGMPELVKAGNVLRPFTALKLSLRVPPTFDATKGKETLKNLLEENPPYNAKVSFKADKAAAGWEAPAFKDWLTNSMTRASEAVYNRPPAYLGEGGSIPFMGMLGKKFPAAQFVITGVLGPESNAHGPNEFLHLGMAKNITTCVAVILADALKQVQ